METLDVFSVRDLRTRSSDLLKDAELGQLAIITKHGRPAILAVPFDRRLLDQGVHRALALTLFETSAHPCTGRQGGGAFPGRVHGPAGTARPGCRGLSKRGARRRVGRRPCDASLSAGRDGQDRRRGCRTIDRLGANRASVASEYTLRFRGGPGDRPPRVCGWIPTGPGRGCCRIPLPGVPSRRVLYPSTARRTSPVRAWCSTPESRQPSCWRRRHPVVSCSSTSGAGERSPEGAESLSSARLACCLRRSVTVCWRQWNRCWWSWHNRAMNYRMRWCGRSCAWPTRRIDRRKDISRLNCLSLLMEKPMLTLAGEISSRSHAPAWECRRTAPAVRATGAFARRRRPVEAWWLAVHPTCMRRT